MYRYSCVCTALENGKKFVSFLARVGGGGGGCENNTIFPLCPNGQHRKPFPLYLDLQERYKISYILFMCTLTSIVKAISKFYEVSKAQLRVSSNICTKFQNIGFPTSNLLYMYIYLQTFERTIPYNLESKCCTWGIW